MLLLHRCQLLCLLKNASSHIKPWPTLLELAGRFYSGPGSIFWSPQQSVGKDFAHTCRSSLRSYGQELFGHFEQNFSFLEGFLITKMCIDMLHTHMYFGREKSSFRISFEDAFKALTSGRAKMTCGQRHLRAAYMLFPASMKSDTASLGLGKGRWVESWGMSSFPSLSLSPSIAWAVSALGRLPSPMWGQAALISLRLGCNSTLLYAKYPPGCPTFSGSSPVSELL